MTPLPYSHWLHLPKAAKQKTTHFTLTQDAVGDQELTVVMPEQAAHNLFMGRRKDRTMLAQEPRERRT